MLRDDKDFPKARKVDVIISRFYHDTTLKSSKNEILPLGKRGIFIGFLWLLEMRKYHEKTQGKQKLDEKY